MESAFTLSAVVRPQPASGAQPQHVSLGFASSISLSEAPRSFPSARRFVSGHNRVSLHPARNRVFEPKPALSFSISCKAPKTPEEDAFNLRDFLVDYEKETDVSKRSEMLTVACARVVQGSAQLFVPELKGELAGLGGELAGLKGEVAGLKFAGGFLGVVILLTAIVASVFK
eukprot:tig00000448_g897.t1